MVSAAGPVALRISLTDRCQLRCSYCMPSEGALQHEQPLSSDQIIDFVRLVGQTFGLTKVHLTGGEPLLRDDIITLVGMLAKLPVGDLALTTNGQRLGELAGPLRQAGLNRINVSLDSVDQQTFRTITRGGEIKPTLEGIAQARACGLLVKLNTVVMRGVNDAEVVDIARWGLERGCCVRFLELMPIGPASDRFEESYVSTAQVKETLSRAFELTPLPTQAGCTAREYLARDGAGMSGIIGFISSGSQPFCQGCGRLRLAVSGRLIGCLGLGLGPQIRPLLEARDEELLIEAVHTALGLKRVNDSFTTSNLMIHTGG